MYSGRSRPSDKGVGGDGHQAHDIREGGLVSHQASVWSKNKGGGTGLKFPGPLPWIQSHNTLLHVHIIYKYM